MDGIEAFPSVKHGGGAPDGTIINRLMLRFRPIAPKPVSGGSVSCRSGVESKSVFVGTKRAKRKYVRVRRNKRDRTNKGRKGISDDDTKDGSKGSIVTLQLMPEKADLVKSRESDDCCLMDLNVDENLKVIGSNTNTSVVGVTDRVSRVSQTRVVESWVVVESVTGTCMEEEGLGLTDMSRMKNLEADTCPGFISDGQNRVLWVNEAYKNMVMSATSTGRSEERPPKVAVQLMVEERLLRRGGSFSCVLRVRYDGQNEKCGRLLPCDVWRMDFGGLAWRLDLKAALSLGTLTV